MYTRMLMMSMVVGVVALVSVCHATDSQDSVQLEEKSKQSWSNYDGVKSVAEEDDFVDEDKRGAHIFRYGRAPVFRYGKRATPVFRFGKKATVFRYGKRSQLADDDVAVLVPVDESTLGRFADSDDSPVAEEHKRKIFRYGKRSM